MESWTLLPKGMLVTFQLSTNSASPWESLVLLWWFALWVIKGWIVNALWWSICSTLTLFDLTWHPIRFIFWIDLEPLISCLSSTSTFPLFFYIPQYSGIYIVQKICKYIRRNEIKTFFDWELIFQTPVTPFSLSSNFFPWKNNLFKRFLNFAYILTSSYCWFPPLTKL